MGLRYLVRRDGPMAACTAMVHALARSDPSLDRPDVKIQMHTLSAEDRATPTGWCSTNSRLWHRQLRPSAAVARLGAPRIRRSGGTARHRRQLPCRPRDRATSIAALRLVRRIADQPALKALIVREVRPGRRRSPTKRCLRTHRKLAPPLTIRSATVVWAAIRCGGRQRATLRRTAPAARPHFTYDQRFQGRLSAMRRTSRRAAMLVARSRGSAR